MTNKYIYHIIMLTLILAVSGCGRGRTSTKPPVHPNPNMDTQQKLKPFRESNFFADGLSMRKPVEGTIARGELREDRVYFTGSTESGSFIPLVPVPVTGKLLDRGQERYNIYCSPCHGMAGDGKGIITKYEYPIPPTNLHESRIQLVEDGFIYSVISDGIRNMPAYDHQIHVRDRWAIVAYVRALQLSQSIPGNLLPEKLKSGINQ